MQDVGSADWLVTSVFGLVAVVQLLSHVQLFANLWTGAPSLLLSPTWKIPWTEEPGVLQSMGSLRVGHD